MTYRAPVGAKNAPIGAADDVDEFKLQVRENGFIGLVNLTDQDIKFTSYRLLMAREQV